MTTVYVVEDSTITRLALQDALSKEGFKIVGCNANGEKAIDEIFELRPEVVLLDINLSGQMTGTTLGKKVRTFSNCVIIYITAYGDATTQEKVFATQPDGYILKPYRIENVSASIRIALSRKRSSHTSKNHDLTSQLGTIVVKSNGENHVVPIHEIIYAHSNANYMDLFTDNAIYTLRSPLKKFLLDFPDAGMVQVHQRFLVNPKRVSDQETMRIQVLDRWIPLGRKFRKAWLTVSHESKFQSKT